MMTPHTPIDVRFWAKVDSSGGAAACWPWTAGRGRNGYGQFRLDGKTVSSHRVAFDLTNGPIPRGLSVLHTCDNRPCCNPQHLYAGTLADNMRDMVLRGRSCAGEMNGRARLSEADVREIRQRYVRGRKPSQAEIAREFGVAGSLISHIVRGVNWPFPITRNEEGE